MSKARVLPDDRVVEIAAGESLLDASLRAELAHTHVCGGTARCSTCRVRVEAGLDHCAPRTPAEQRIADRLRFGAEIRLACQTTIDGDVTVRRLVLDPDDVRLTDHLRPDAGSRAVGQQKTVAVMFADIRGFTAFSESLPPYDVIHTLSRYFFRMEAVIRQHHGTVDNYMGDGLMALFGADDRPDAALAAVLAGLEMLAAVEALGPYFESVLGKRFQIGIGVHFGEVVMGTIAPPGADKITAIGDTVNTASRIEGANKLLGTRFLISEATRDVLGERVRVTRHEGVALAGKAGRHVLYEVRGLQGSS
ncbi:MAG: adenylate/guanylate cyclase domain-containing protein [Polyangiaceae bacterium]|nr:adenylate/guanylate cyclase domain-containing protein [Polyangiaceae bacterium]